MTVRELLELAQKRVTGELERESPHCDRRGLRTGAGFESQQAREQARAVFERARDRARQAGDVPREATALSLLATVAYESSHIEEAWDRALESAGVWSKASAAFRPRQAVEVLAISGQLMQYMRPADARNREYLEHAAGAKVSVGSAGRVALAGVLGPG